MREPLAVTCRCRCDSKILHESSQSIERALNLLVQCLVVVFGRLLGNQTQLGALLEGGEIFLGSISFQRQLADHQPTENMKESCRK